MADSTAGKMAEQLIREEMAPVHIARVVITATSDGRVIIQGQPANRNVIEQLIIGGLKALWLREQETPSKPKVKIAGG